MIICLLVNFSTSGADPLSPVALFYFQTLNSYDEYINMMVVDGICFVGDIVEAMLDNQKHYIKFAMMVKPSLDLIVYEYDIWCVNCR